MEEERVEPKDGRVDEERSGHESSEGTEHTMGLGKRQRKASHRFEREEIELSKVTKPDKKKRRIVRGKENPKGRMAKASAKKSNIVYVTIPVGESKVLPSVALSHVDKASQLVLSEDQMTCRGCEGGYRMIRATHGVHRGGYFWEALILPSHGPDAHYRIGWSTRQGDLQAPVGFDQYSYGYRDTGGSRIHNSVRIDNFGEGFAAGDVIGCYIYLDDNSLNNKIVFFKNGASQGVAYQGLEVKPGIYFPAISIYMEGSVRANFGPSFIVGHDIPGAHPVSEFQPYHPLDRQEHDRQIQLLQQDFHKRKEELAVGGLSSASVDNDEMS